VAESGTCPTLRLVVVFPGPLSESTIDVTVVSVAPKTKVSQALET